MTEETTPHTESINTKKEDNLSIPFAIVFSGLLVAGAIIFSNKEEAPRVAGAPSVPTRQ